METDQLTRTETDAAVPASPDTTTTRDRRDLLRERIEAGERRNAERGFADYAKDTADSVTTFAKEHPIATVAGAIGLGLAIGAMTRPGRRLARQGAHKTGTLAALASEAVLAFGAGLIDDVGALARNSGDALEDAGDRIGQTARTARRGAAYKASVLADEVAATRRKAGRKASRGLRDLRNRARH